MRKLGAAGLALAVAGVLALAPLSASARQRLLIMPFEIPDVIAEGEYLPRPVKEGPRIALATAELTQLLSADPRFDIVDPSPLAAEIKKAAPLHKCNGCAVDIAKKAGADLIVTGLVEKLSDVLLNMTLQITDVASDKVTRSGSTVLQGNTDETWLRGVRWLYKNRLLAEKGSSQ